jgi:hypothetical protein
MLIFRHLVAGHPSHLSDEARRGPAVRRLADLPAVAARKNITNTWTHDTCMMIHARYINVKKSILMLH